MQRSILAVELRYEHDIVVVRQRSREIAKLLGFTHQEQSRISTAVSEIARNAFKYAGGGTARFLLEDTGQQTFLVRISDSGPGIPNLQAILDGEYKSNSGMGI